jgi:hypothetical protein
MAAHAEPPQRWPVAGAMWAGVQTARNRAGTLQSSRIARCNALDADQHTHVRKNAGFDSHTSGRYLYDDPSSFAPPLHRLCRARCRRRAARHAHVRRSPIRRAGQVAAGQPPGEGARLCRRREHDEESGLQVR